MSVRPISGQAGQVAGQAAAGQTAWSDPVASRVVSHVVDSPAGQVTSGTAGQVADSSWLLRAADGDQQTSLMLYAGRPPGEPVVAGGPFVMNTDDEIRQAYADFRLGKFGHVPRAARLRERSRRRPVDLTAGLG